MTPTRPDTIDPNNSIYSVLSLASLVSGDTVVINSGTYPSETPYTLDKNLTIMYPISLRIR